MWTPDVIRFCLLILVGASLLVQHLRLLRRALRTRSLSMLTKAACFLPPIPVYVAYRHGARRSFWLWLLLVAAYAALLRYHPALQTGGYPLSSWPAVAGPLLAVARLDFIEPSACEPMVCSMRRTPTFGSAPVHGCSGRSSDGGLI